MDPRERARRFLSGESLTFAEADALWRALAKGDIPLARSVLSRLREGITSRREDIISSLDGLTPALRIQLRQQEALLTSKDPELSVATKHTLAIGILSGDMDLADPSLDNDAETLGIAGGIYKRLWYDLGQLADLKRAASYYGRAANAPVGNDAYPHINAAFLEDLLANTGDATETRRANARRMRERIVQELTPANNWWNAASRAEALFGLERYAEATAAITGVPRPKPWELETTARQIATLAEMQDVRSLERDDVRAFFDALLGASIGKRAASPGVRSTAVRSAFLGKVGLALSGGGFRASFYHLGVLARLAELDVLRHVDVLSCVSGGSIVGACYWLALRKRLIEAAPLDRDAYVAMIADLIQHFQQAVGYDLRRGIQPSRVRVAYRVFVKGQQGALDPEQVAVALERDFYRPLLPGNGPLYMHDLALVPPNVPRDHDPAITQSDDFNPIRDNWLRHDKVPALVINATTVNTGHAWQFTPTWMGESPWAVHEAADAVPRLDWAPYDPAQGWQVTLAHAVAASACVPGVFEPLVLNAPYQSDLTVRLVDGGVYDNQGTVSLLALNCNVLLVSDACGQLLLEPHPGTGLRGLGQHATRSMDTLMERVRQANFGDLSARVLSGLVRGMMILHMKAGLDADPIRLQFAPEAYELRRAALTRSGVRKDFQQALAELRTDLDAFTPEESNGLMACGYQMASKAFQWQLSHLTELWDQAATPVAWPFDSLRAQITSTQSATSAQKELLAALRAGNTVQL